VDWDTDAMRDTAQRLRRLAGDLRHRRRLITTAMQSAGRWHTAYRQLDTTAVWADGEADELDRRATSLDGADGSMHLNLHLGWLDLDLELDPGTSHWVPSSDSGAGAAILDTCRRDPEVLIAIVRFLDAHPSSGLARSLFAVLGPAGTAAIPSVIAEAFGDDPETARRLLESLAVALAEATGDGYLGFGAAELVAAWQESLSLYHPVELLRFGDFSEEFRLEMAVLLLEPYGEHFLPMPLPVTRAFDSPGTPGIADRRLIVLDSIAGDTACSAALVERLADRGMLAALLFPATPFDDNGTAAGRVLAELGTAADPSGPWAVTASATSARRAIEAVVGAISRHDLPLPDGVAIGSTAMMRTSLASVIPSGYAWDGDAYARPLLGTAPRLLQDVPRDPGLYLDEAELRDFLYHVLASDAAAAALLDIVSTWITAEVTMRTAHDQVLILDELAGLLGRVVEIRSRIEIEQGRAADSRNGLIRTVISMVAGALTLGTPANAPLWVTFLTGTASGTGTDRFSERLFPSDTEQKALARSLDRADEYEKAFWLVLSVAGIWNTEPDWFGDTPPPTDTAERLLLPDLSEGPHSPEQERVLELWNDWMKRLPADRLLELERLAGLAIGQMSQADELEGAMPD